MLNSILTLAVISSVARNLLDSSTYAIHFLRAIYQMLTLCWYLRIQEISRYARNDNLMAVCAIKFRI